MKYGRRKAWPLLSAAMLTRLALPLILVLSASSALAAPSRIIILPGGEGADPWKLCEIGEERAKALALTYLGREAPKSLFANGDEPAFFFAITPKTAALASPSVASWKKPIILYSAIPESNQEDFAKALNRRTQEVARNVLANPTLQGKTVVLVWESEHIASEALEAKFESETVTLRQLFKLDILPGVPKTWSGTNDDYFWVVEFPPNANVPAKFSMVKQEFGTSFPRVPANDWDTPDGLDATSGCVPAAKN